MNKMKPILFSTPMVQTILDGKKTQTRRVIKIDDAPENWKISIAGTSIVRTEPYDVKLPRYAAGAILWVRETWAQVSSGIIEYKAGYKEAFTSSTEVDHIGNKIKWKPSIFMPREAARIFLRVTSVRVERVQDISEADAKAEGIKSYWDEPHRDVAPFIGAAKELGADLCHTRREAFEQLWDSLNKKRGYGWDVNPWVWVYEFERVEGMKC